MPLLTEKARGVYVIAATPFAEDGALDLASTDRMVDFYLERGIDGLTLLGVMGEAPKLTAAESRQIVRRVLARTAGRVPVIVGVSSPGLAAMRELAQDVMADGAAGVMVAPVSTLRSDDQIFDYFSLVAATLGPDVPVALQDHPLATGVQLPTSVILRIFKTLPSFVMLKHEDWPGPGLAKISAIRAASDKGEVRRFSILSGNGGGLFLPEELSRGADGAMTGFAYPEMMVDVCAAHAGGDIERAHDLFDAYLPLARYEQQAGIGLAVRKHLMVQRGAIASAMVRKPGPALSAADRADIERLVRRQERRLHALDASS
ncbi:MAG: dihydrodipicolinate synthase family protein [Deltaproteobacteria bacterium]|nr:dihydrodipicolinate synthase family protein [Deltaproteobacteria bacterium]